MSASKPSPDGRPLRPASDALRERFSAALVGVPRDPDARPSPAWQQVIDQVWSRQPGNLKQHLAYLRNDAAGMRQEEAALRGLAERCVARPRIRLHTVDMVLVLADTAGAMAAALEDTVASHQRPAARRS
jgi:hypothetical protein